MRHGVRGSYVRGCHCPECTEANRAYVARTERAKLYGTWESTFTDATPVRAHVDWLRSLGMGTRVISEQSGVARSAIAGLYRSNKTGRPAKQVSRVTAARLLAVRPARALGSRVPGHGTARRLQALVAHGWPQAELARRIGWTSANFQRLLEDSPVRLDTAMNVRALYDALWNRRGPSERARRLAAKKGWPGPLAWDDDTIDNPRAKPRV